MQKTKRFTVKSRTSFLKALSIHISQAPFCCPRKEKEEMQFMRQAGAGRLMHYQVAEIESFRATKKYDAVGLIYVHLPGSIRENFHRQIHHSLNSGGYLVFEAFAKEQIHFNSGGPKEPSMLYDAPTVCNDFARLTKRVATAAASALSIFGASPRMPSTVTPLHPTSV